MRKWEYVHVKQVHGYSCNICGKHSGDLTKAKASTSYTCRSCHRWFKTKNASQIHVSREQRGQMLWTSFLPHKHLKEPLLQGNWALLKICSTSVKRWKDSRLGGLATSATSLFITVAKMCGIMLRVDTTPTPFNILALIVTKSVTLWGPWKCTSLVLTEQVFKKSLWYIWK